MPQRVDLGLGGQRTLGVGQSSPQHRLGYVNSRETTEFSVITQSWQSWPFCTTSNGNKLIIVEKLWCRFIFDMVLWIKTYRSSLRPTSVSTLILKFRNVNIANIVYFGKSLTFAIIFVRVMKRAKVMFSQAYATHSIQLGGRWTTPKVSPPPGQDQRSTTYPPDQGQRSNTSPPYGQGRRSTTSPLTRVRGQTTSPTLARVRGQTTFPPTPRTPEHYAQAGGTHPTGMHSCLSVYRSFRLSQ